MSKPDTPPGRRFYELVLLIEDYKGRRNGYLLLGRGTRTTTAVCPVFDRAATEARRRSYG